MDLNTVTDWLKNKIGYAPQAPTPGQAAPPSGHHFGGGDAALVGGILAGSGMIPATMAGIAARTANKSAHNAALKEMAGGKSLENIYNRTGWYPRKGSGMAFEIPDKNMQVKPLPNVGPGTGLEAAYGRFAEHPELMKAYPQLGLHRVKIDPNFPETHGLYEPGQITLGGEVYPQGLTANQQQTLIHEGQHGVQKIENWLGKGANLDDTKKQIMKTLVGRLQELPPAGLNLDAPGLGIPEGLQRDYVTRILKKFNTSPGTIGMKIYRGDPGETESRNAMDRFMFDKFGQDTSNPQFSTHSQAQEVLGPLGLDYTRMMPNADRTTRVMPYYTLKNAAGQVVLPSTLPNDARAVIDRLPDPANAMRGMVGERKYPWKTEDLPRSEQFDFNSGLSSDSDFIDRIAKAAGVQPLYYSKPTYWGPIE